MPVLRSLRARLGEAGSLDGLKIAACLHVTAETGVLLRVLQAGGASVALCAANPLSTQDDVAAALAGDGMLVRARRGASDDEVSALAAWGPQITLDDGADLLIALHSGSAAGAAPLGATEETTTGLIRARALEAAGRLRCPVLALNEAQIERGVCDTHGTGQSVLDGIVRAAGVLLPGRTVVVLGYGACGTGVALRARGAGAQVLVCEVDPLRALEARLQGFEVLPALEAAVRGDVFVTVTGSRRVLTREHFERMRDGAVLANGGHFDVEIDLPALAELSADVQQVLPLVAQHVLADGRALNLLASGRVVNLAAAEGHPAAVMDLSFALHALAVEYLAGSGGALGAGVHPVPAGIDREVASLELAALGVAIDTLTDDQRDYLRSWGS